MEDVTTISEKLTKLSAEGAKAVDREFMKTSSDEDWSDWRVFMKMIFALEAQNKDAKRQFLTKLTSIAEGLTNKSDSDVDILQRLAESQIRGQFFS